MINESSTILLIVGITGAATVLAMLNVLSSIINHETKIIDYRNHVKDMQYQHALYMARLENRIPDNKRAQTTPPTSSPSSADDPEQSSAEPEPQSDSIPLPEQASAQAA